MKFVLASVLALAATAALADQSTMANVPTGYQVKGPAYYSLVSTRDGWRVNPRREACGIAQRRADDRACLMGGGDGAGAGNGK